MKRLLLGMLLLTGMYLLCVFIFSNIPYNIQFNSTPNGIPVFLSSNGVHTDFVVPVKTTLMNWNDFIPDIPPHCQYISIGWGDKGFYLNTPTWGDLTFSTAFEAAFGLSTTAIHIDFIHQIPSENDLCQGVTVSNWEYQQLCSYIKNSFQQNSEGKLQPIPFNTLYYNGSFYDANGTYSLFTSCNSWINKGCKESGIRTCLWTPLDKPLLRALSGY